MSFDLAKQYSPELPWCNDDPEMLGPVVTAFARDFDNYLVPWSQRWFENFQFIYGNQDVRWSKRWGFAMDVDYLQRGSRAVNQKSQTNISRTIYEALANMLYGSLPTWNATAVDEASSQSRRFEEISKSVLEAYQARLMMDKQFRNFVGILTAYGVAGMKMDWSTQAGRIMDIPQYEEQLINIETTEVREAAPFGLVEVPTLALDDQGQPMVEKRLVPKRDAEGKPVSKRAWAGDCRMTVLSPFEYRRDPHTQDIERAKWFEHIRVMDWDDYLAEYLPATGKTKYFEKVRPGMMQSSAYDYCIRNFLRMTFVNPVRMQDVRKLVTGALNQVFIKSKVVVVEHYDRPNEQKWPEGRKLVITNGFCTHVQDGMQYHTNRSWHPFTEANWLKLAPAAMPAGPINDVVSKNRELNVLDSVTDTSTFRNLGSMYLVKNGSGLDSNRMWGEPGQIFDVNDINAINIIRDPMPIPPIIGEIRNQKKEDSYEMSAAGDSIRGDRSKGANSGYQAKLYEEREQKRLTPVRREVEAAFGQMGEKLLACLRSNCMSLDSNVYGFLVRSAAGRFQEKDIPAFLTLPLDYGIEVDIVVDSMITKSKASNQATLMELVTKTPAGNRLQNADVMDEFLKYFDAEILRDDSAPHRDRARRENEQFSDIGKVGPSAVGVSLPIVLFEDDDDIHIAAHTRDLIEDADRIRENPFELFIRMQHLELHRLQKKEKAGEVVPGTSNQGRQIYSQVSGQQAKNLPMVFAAQAQQDQAKQQQQMQASQAQQAATKPPGGPQPPPGPGGQPPPAGGQAPAGPAPVGQPGAAIDTSSASQNTPAGRSFK